MDKFKTDYVYEVTYVDGNSEIFYDRDKAKVTILREYLDGMAEYSDAYPPKDILYDTQTWIVMDYIKNYCRLEKVEWATIWERRFGI